MYTDPQTIPGGPSDDGEPLGLAGTLVEPLPGPAVRRWVEADVLYVYVISSYDTTSHAVADDLEVLDDEPGVPWMGLERLP